MTPKEKAKELVDRFNNIEIYISIEPTDIECQIKHTQCDAAKQCALIVVDEIIKTDMLIDEDTFVETPSYLQYWKEVKKEIDNLEEE